jgi:hypothetical protein
VPMTVNKIFTAIGFSIALMAPATAAEIKFIGSDIISVSGRIEAGDHLTISRIVLAKMPDSTTITLNSGGGFGNAAFLMGRAIRNRGLATKIPAGARCDSACSFLWLAGARREIDCQARIGLHAPRISRTFEPTEPGNKLMANYMAEMGAPKEMIDLALQTDLSSATYVDHAQLRQWGLVNSPACPQSHPRNSGRRSGSPVPR